MDNITNIVYNIKAIDNATATINGVAASLRVLKRLSPINIKINTIYNTKNKITNTVNDVYKASASLSMKLSRTLQDTYKQTQTFQTNVINKNKNIDEQVNKIKNSTSGVKDQAKKTHAWFSDWKKTLSSVVKRFISLRVIANYIAQGVELSADYVENLHLLEVAFGDNEKEAKQFGRTISNTFGTSINETNKFLSVFRQMTSAIGIADQTSSRMSETLTALGYDIASLYNLSIQSAMEKLQAGIAGQTKPLRTLGMDITAQSLDNYLENTLKLSNVISKQMTQADKMILRTIVIMEQARNAVGDMGESINSFANQMKVLKGSISNLKLAIGDLAEATLQPLISALAGIVIAITKIIRVFVPLKEDSGIENTIQNLKSVNNELDEIVETTGLLSFDKFNALSKKGSGSDAINITDTLSEVFNEKYSEYMKNFQESMSKVKSDATEVARSIITWAFPDAVVDDLGNVVGELGKANILLRGIKETLKIIVSIKIASLLTKLVPIIQTAALQMKLFSMEAGALKMSLQALSGVFAFALIYQIVNLIDKWKELDGWGKTWRIMLIALTAGIFLYSSGLTTAIGQMIKFAVVGVTKMITSLKGVGLTLKSVIKTTLSFTASVSGLMVGISALVAGFMYFINNLNNMSSTAKILIPIIATLTAVFVGLAVARAAAQAGIAAPVMAGITAAALTAGIVLAAGTAMSIGKFADGGFPEHGQLFIANEAGAELVGNIGGKTGVANNDMIVQALESAAYRGFIRAIDDSGMNAQRSGGNVTLNINGKEFARATAPDMASEFNRRNIKFK